MDLSIGLAKFWNRMYFLAFGKYDFLMQALKM